jgi:DNA-binding SARP family transcriptional activator
MDQPPPPQAQLSLIGGFELRFGGDPLSVSGPAQRLLACLAILHRGRPVARLSLAERLWCDAPPQRAAASLRAVLWRLPRPRGRVLVVGTASTVRLHE